jgi:non-ribosomal peptide synthetase component F
VLRADSDTDDEPIRDVLRDLASTTALLLFSKRSFSDSYARLVRTEAMNAAAEMQWNLTPPPAYAGHDATVGPVMEPAYQIGGDAFDYAVAGTTLHRLRGGRSGDLRRRDRPRTLEEAWLACVVADPAASGAATGLAPVTVDVTAVLPAADGPRHRPDPRELAHVIFTSGSTGRPKAVGVEHAAVASHVAAARQRLGITGADRVLAFASFSFDASLAQVLPALTAAATVVMRPDEPWLPTQVPKSSSGTA